MDCKNNNKTTKNICVRLYVSKSKKIKSYKHIKQKPKFSDNKKPNNRKIIVKNQTFKKSLNLVNTHKIQWQKLTQD